MIVNLLLTVLNHNFEIMVFFTTAISVKVKI